MDIEIEDIDNCNKKIKVKIAQEDYRQQCLLAYASLSKDAKFPGFRKGKIPLSMLEKKFGVEVKKEVLSQLISEKITEAIKEKQLKALSAPSVLEVHGDEGKDISVTATIEVIPEIELKDYKSIEVEMKINKVTDEDVDRMIEYYRLQNAKDIPVKDRFVEKGDYIKIDYHGLVNGKPFDGSTSKDYTLQVGGGNLVDGFDEQMIGVQFGEEKNFQLPISDKHPNKQIAGKKVDFRVQVMSIFTKELPELNDEFAKVAIPGRDFETLNDMKLAFKNKMEEEERAHAKKAGKEQFAAKLAELNPVDIPEKLVQEQIQFMVARELQAAEKMNPSAQGQDSKSDEGPREEVMITPEHEKKYRERSVRLLQQEFVVSKLAEKLEIEVTEAEISREISGFAKMMGRNNPKRMKNEMEKSGALLRLESRMRRDKTFDRIWSEIQIKEEFVDREKIIADN